MNEPAKKKSSSVRWIFIVAGGCALCVPVIGILAAIAIPAFISYVRRSKVAEARAELMQVRALVTERCAGGGLPERAGPQPPVPGAEKQLGDFRSDPVFAELGYDPGVPVYYSYAIEPDAFGGVRLVARGDLDSDGHLSEHAIQCDATCACGEITTIDELE